MIATIETSGVVKSRLGSYFFTERMGENRFMGIAVAKAIRNNGLWTHESPKLIEIIGDFLIELSPRSIPILVDEEFINSQLPDEELTWEQYEEVLETLKEF